jgi:transketolase N-terminal domain/subunit
LGVAKMRPQNVVYVVVGDGEMQEGSCSEALLAMGRLGVGNVEVHVDGNGMQGMGNCPKPWFPVVFYHNTVKGDDWSCHYRNA